MFLSQVMNAEDVDANVAESLFVTYFINPIDAFLRVRVLDDDFAHFARFQERVEYLAYPGIGDSVF